MTRAVIQLLIGAMAIGFAPIFVKLLMAMDGVDPLGAGFWRMFLGAVGFGLTLFFAKNRREALRGLSRVLESGVGLAALAGLLFALDLAAWHTSFKHTSVAVSTLIANLSAIFVPVAGVIFFRERFSQRIVIGGVTAMIGVAGLILSRDSGLGLGSAHGQSLWSGMGEGLAFLTAFFYTGYMLCIKKLTKTFTASSLMLISSAMSALLLFLFAWALGERILPRSMEGWGLVLGLGLVSQVMGQGLIAKALGVLPVSQSALILLSAPASTAVFGWIFLGEPLGLPQVVSILVTLSGLGVVVMRPANRRDMEPAGQ